MSERIVITKAIAKAVMVAVAEVSGINADLPEDGP